MAERNSVPGSRDVVTALVAGFLDLQVAGTELVSDTQEPPHFMAEAMEWVARITAVGIEMVLPGIGGHWLDRRLGTSFLGLIGFAIGITAGLWHLLLMTQAASAKRNRTGKRNDRGKNRDKDIGS